MHAHAFRQRRWDAEEGALLIGSHMRWRLKTTCLGRCERATPLRPAPRAFLLPLPSHVFRLQAAFQPRLRAFRHAACAACAARRSCPRSPRASLRYAVIWCGGQISAIRYVPRLQLICPPVATPTEQRFGLSDSFLMVKRRSRHGHARCRRHGKITSGTMFAGTAHEWR